MAKRFSIVYINNQELFYSGYMFPKDLAESKTFLNEVFEISQFEKEEVEVVHCRFLDFDDEEDTDLPIDDLDDLVDMFDVLNEAKHCIDFVEVVKFDVDGAKADEIVDG